MAFSRTHDVVTAGRPQMLRDVPAREATLMPSNSRRYARRVLGHHRIAAFESGTIMISSKLEDELLYDEDEDDDDDDAPERSAPEWVGKFAAAEPQHGPAIAFDEWRHAAGGRSRRRLVRHLRAVRQDHAARYPEAADGKLDVEPGRGAGVGNAEFVAAAFDGVVESATEVAYVDTDGDSIIFKEARRTARLRVNGEVETESISSLQRRRRRPTPRWWHEHHTPQDRADSKADGAVAGGMEEVRRRLPVGRAS